MPDPTGFHARRDALLIGAAERDLPLDPAFRYTFENFFHPFVGALIERLNSGSLPGLLDPDFHQRLAQPFFASHYQALESRTVRVQSHCKEIDVRTGGPYANYNWELLFHVPVAVASHLASNQRFAEAQRWLHYVFDPTSTDTSVPPPARYWRFLRFRPPPPGTAPACAQAPLHDVQDLLTLLSTPGDELTTSERAAVRAILESYAASREAPFSPHAVAATRPVSYQYWVVMKYLDNLIAWGDSLFREDTAESVNEATQRYVMAANILGPRPQQLPARGTVPAKTFAQLRGRLDQLGNALVELEAQFPFNDAPSSSRYDRDSPQAAPLAGLGRTLYFCVPRNEKLLSYWDTVADRLFKVRNCMNLEGLSRQLALFEPAIDPGLLVKATAAGVDPGALGGAANALGPLRATFLLRQALDLCNEVRALGGALLAAMEKADAEGLALLRQGHEVKVQQMAQDVRFLLWRQSERATDVLLRGRAVALERHHYYQRMLGLPGATALEQPFVINRSEPGRGPLLTEANFERAFAELVRAYDREADVQSYAALRRADEAAPGTSEGGKLGLTATEDKELNDHLPAARDLRAASSVLDTVASVLTLIPNLSVDMHFWGLGIHAEVFGGDKLAEVSRIAANIVRTMSGWEADQAAMAGRTAAYERRADEWVLQNNLAAHELMQIGRQVLGAVIAEQAAHAEYENARRQVEQTQAVDGQLRSKQTNQELYRWMQGEVTRLHYEYYRFAVDVARKAEQAVKRELMRPEVDAVQYVRADHLGGGRRGLLAGDALALDIKRLEMAYHENRRREYELTRHVSLMQLDPLALMRLRTTGACEISIPEALFDLDCPGHYLRRIKQVRLSIPAVAGPYTSVACTLSLQRSSVRTSPIGAGYARRAGGDDRFADSAGVIQAIVTSDARDDGGTFPSSTGDERFLPFEGAGAISSWRLELPREFRQFDYDTIADVILHVQYTAREGGGTLRQAAVDSLTTLVTAAQAAGSTRLLSVRTEFPAAWAQFQNAPPAPGARTRRLELALDERHYPYWSHGLRRQVTGVALIARPVGDTRQLHVSAVPAPADDQRDTLVADKSLDDLLQGQLKRVPLPQATGALALHLEDRPIEELWVLVSWSGTRG